MTDDFLYALPKHTEYDISLTSLRKNGSISQKYDSTRSNLPHDNITTVRVETGHNLVTMDITQSDLESVANGLNQHNLQSKSWYFLQIELTSFHLRDIDKLGCGSTLHRLIILLFASESLKPELNAALLLVTLDDFKLAQAVRLLLCLDFDALAHGFLGRAFLATLSLLNRVYFMNQISEVTIVLSDCH